jgi:uncharacterized protein YndB with AHSA1/START domain
MTDQTETRESVVVDYQLEEPPHQVWRALTEPDLLAAWLGPNDIRPEVGHRFRVEAAPDAGGAAQCEVLEVEPDRTLTYSWREAREDGPALDSQVTWTITPRFDGGTHLRLVHDGFSLVGGRVLALAGAAGGLSRDLRGRTLGTLLADIFRLAA